MYLRRPISYLFHMLVKVSRRELVQNGEDTLCTEMSYALVSDKLISERRNLQNGSEI